jgi:hypothetical protein
MSKKPILFHDIDGVLFGEYDGEFQLRPGVKTWLKWAHEHFEIVWLTSWAPEKVKTLLSVLYCEKFMKHLAESSGTRPDQPFQCANWMNYANKETWLQDAIPKLQGRSWFWIDDLIEEDLASIKACGLSVERCIQVSAKGAGALEELRGELERLRYERV